MNVQNLIKQYLVDSANPVFEVSVEYVTSSSDYVDESDRGTLKTLTVVARTYTEYTSFFMKVYKLMATQCDCPAGSDDLQIHLSPVFKVTFYRCEKEFLVKKPRTHVFVKFKDEFYKNVSKLRSR